MQQRRVFHHCKISALHQLSVNGASRLQWDAILTITIGFSLQYAQIARRKEKTCCEYLQQRTQQKILLNLLRDF